MAALLFASGQAEEGAAAVDRALELAPHDLRPLRKRAQFRAATGQLDDALRDLERYLGQRPDDAGALFMLGFVHESDGRSEPAIAAYGRAAELDAAAFAPRNNLAMLLAESDLESDLEAKFILQTNSDTSRTLADTVGDSQTFR